MAKIAMLLGTDFEDTEFRVPYDRLKRAGHDVVLVGAKKGETVEGKTHRETVTIEATAKDVDPAQLACIVIPGGYSPDHLRSDEGLVDLLHRCATMGRPIAAICHGPQMLIEADLVAGRTVTSWPSIKKDLLNAGATWVDREVVRDGQLITSRNPHDADAFAAAILEAVASSRVDGRAQVSPS